MASVSKGLDTNSGENTETRQILKLSDCICSICMYIMIEPVTMPCRHELCMSCFRQNVQEASLTCPMCRLRISTWARKAARHNTLIDQRRWKAIQEAFPTQVQNRIDGKEEDYASDDEAVVVYNIAEPGEIRKEYEKELKKLQAEAEMRQQEELKKSEALIMALQEEEENKLRDLEQQRDSDAELARKLNDAMNQDSDSSVFDTPAVQNFLSRSKRNGTLKSDDPLMQRYLNRARKEAGKKTPTGRKGDTYPYRCISPWEKEPEKPAAASSKQSSPSRYSDIFTRASRPGSTTSESETVPYVYVSSRGNSCNPSPSSDLQLLRSEFPPDVKSETPILPIGLDDDLCMDTSLLPTTNLGLNFSGDCEITDVELPFAHLSPNASVLSGPNRKRVIAALSKAPATAARASTSSSIKSEDTVDAILKEMAEADEETEVKEEEKESPGLPRSPSRESFDSISQELNHFKPIRTCPKTPPRRLPGGQIVEIPLVRSLPMKSLTMSPHSDEDGKTSEPTSPIVQRRLLQLEAERNAQVEAMSKGTCTEKHPKKPYALKHDHSYSSPQKLQQQLNRNKSATSAATGTSPESIVLNAARGLNFDSGEMASSDQLLGEEQNGEAETILPLECNLEEDINASFFPPLPNLQDAATNESAVDASKSKPVVMLPPRPQQFTVSLLPSGGSAPTKVPSIGTQVKLPTSGPPVKGKVYQMKISSQKGPQSHTSPSQKQSHPSIKAPSEPVNSAVTPGKGSIGILRHWLTSPGRSSANLTHATAAHHVNDTVVITSLLTPGGVEKRKEAIAQHNYSPLTPQMVQQRNKIHLNTNNQGASNTEIADVSQTITNSVQGSQSVITLLMPSGSRKQKEVLAPRILAAETPVISQQNKTQVLNGQHIGSGSNEEPTTISETTDTSDTSPLKMPLKKLKHFPSLDISMDTSHKDSSDDAACSVQLKRKRRKAKKGKVPEADVDDKISHLKTSPQSKSDVSNVESVAKKTKMSAKKSDMIESGETGEEKDVTSKTGADVVFVDTRRKAAKQHKYITSSSCDSPRYAQRNEQGSQEKNSEQVRASKEEVAAVKKSLDLEASEGKSALNQSQSVEKESDMDKQTNEKESAASKRKTSSHIDSPRKKSRRTMINDEESGANQPAAPNVNNKPEMRSKRQRKNAAGQTAKNNEESDSEIDSPKKKVHKTRHRVNRKSAESDGGHEQASTSAEINNNASNSIGQGDHVMAEDKENEHLEDARKVGKIVTQKGGRVHDSSKHKDHPVCVTPKKRTQMLRYIEYSPDSTGKKISVRRGGRQKSDAEPSTAKRTKQTKLLFLPQHSDRDDESDFEPDKSQLVRLQRAVTKDIVTVKKSTRNQTKKGPKQIRLKEFMTRQRHRTDSDASEIESAASSCKNSLTSEVRLERSDFQSDSEYQEYIEEQDRQLALKLQADFDLEARYNLNSIRRRGSENEYEFRQKNSTQ